MYSFGKKHATQQRFTDIQKPGSKKIHERFISLFYKTGNFVLVYGTGGRNSG